MPEFKNLNIIGIGPSVQIKEKCYSIDEVYDAVKEHLFDSVDLKKRTIHSAKTRKRVILDGDEVKANSQRLQLFFSKGVDCIHCGTKGKFFLKCKHKGDERYHMELIGQDKNGQLVLMTKDHIVPKSKGGRDVLENYQTMCTVCNCKKGNSTT